MTPLTLFQHAGITPRPAIWSTSVLVLIDVQNEYLDGGLPLPGVEAAVAEIGRLLAAARRDGVPVIHIVHHSPPESALFASGSHGAEIIAGAAPVNGETVIAKTLPNAFARTTLAETLGDLKDATGRGEIVLAGFMTHNCISSTARAALDLGIAVTLVTAATATRDLPDAAGDAIPAALVNHIAIAEIGDRFAALVADSSGISDR